MRRYANWSLKILSESFRRRPSVLHANDTRAFKATEPVARLLQLPVLLTVRDTKAPGESYSRHWRRAARVCHKIVVLSDEMGDILAQEIGAPRELFYTINSIVDLRSFTASSKEERAQIRMRLGIEHDEFAVAVAGAIRNKKNQLELIQKGLPPIIKGVQQARIHFLGDFNPKKDEYSRQCLAASTALGGQVVFHGYQENMADWYRAVDCILIGSRHEGLARAMIEGMACGVPIVSFDVCSAREMLAENGAGYVVPQGDYDGLARSVMEIARKPARRIEMGRRGRAVAEARFNSQQIAGAWDSLYREFA